MSTKETKKSNIGGVDKFKQVFVSKVLILVLLLAVQIAFIAFVYIKLREYVFYWRVFALLLSAFVVLYIVNKKDNPAYKLAWAVVVCSAPLVGGALYVMLAGNRTRLKFIEEALENHLDTDRKSVV